MAVPAGQADHQPLSDRAATHARFVAYRRTRSRTLRNELVEEHLGLTDYFVRRYRYRGVADDDLRQVCLLAVLRAVERYDPGFGVGFSTFASRTIDGDVKRHLRDRTWAVRPPRRAQELYLDVRRAEDELVHECHGPATIDQIAERLGVSVDHVLEALEAGGAHRSVSLDTSVTGAMAESEREPRVLGRTESGYEQVEARQLVEGMLAQLSPRDRDIVEMRYFDNMTQPQIAAALGVSQSYLSRLLRLILEDLRRGLVRGA